MPKLREQDLREAAALLGFEAIQILPYQDGTLADLAQVELEGKIFEAIELYQPEVIFTFGPGGSTHHLDHITIHKATTNIFHRASNAGLPVKELYYEVVSGEQAQQMGLEKLSDGQPNTFVEVAATFEVKLQALTLHARHIKDAGVRLAELEKQPEKVETLYRAYPTVAKGSKLIGLRQN